MSKYNGSISPMRLSYCYRVLLLNLKLVSSYSNYNGSSIVSQEGAVLCQAAPLDLGEEFRLKHISGAHDGWTISTSAPSQDVRQKLSACRKYDEHGGD